MKSEGCARTVMVVEDDPDILETIAEVLEDDAYRPVLASNGASALDQLRAAQTKPCVILLDVMMPILDGRGFRARQQEDPELKGIPVVVLSAHADAALAAVEMQAEGFIRKPVDLHNLLDTVERFCVKD
jgi:CheY-like chemotaxis protein